MKPLDLLTDEEFARLARQAVALPEAPAAWVDKAIAAWAQAPTPAAWAKAPFPAARMPASSPAVSLVAAGTRLAVGALRSLSAVLSFDSGATALFAAGVRGSRSDTRQFIFSTEGRDIDLRVTAGAGRYGVAGQVLGPDETGAVELSAEPAPGPDGLLVPMEAPPAVPSGAAPPALPRRGELDEMGEFRFEGVSRGRYRITLRLGTDLIVLPPIDIGPPVA